MSRIAQLSFALCLAAGLAPAGGVAGGDCGEMKGEYFGRPRPGKTPEILFEVPGKHVQDLELSPDGTEAFLALSNRSWDEFEVVSTRLGPDGTWTEPAPPPFLRPLTHALRPSLSPDGKRLYVISSAPRDPWVSQKTPAGWGAPVRLEEPIDSESIENAVSESADGTLWFCSHRKTPESRGGCDLYASRREGGRYRTEVNLRDLNTEQNDCAPVLSPDGQVLLFHSNRPGGFGGADLWAAFRERSGGWSTPRNLGDKVNSPAMEVIAHFSPDGKYILFTRRAAVQTDEPSKIYWVSAEILGDLKP